MAHLSSGLWCDLCKKPILHGTWWHIGINGKPGHCHDEWEQEHPGPTAKQELEIELEKIHHAIANAQEWYCSDPEDSEMDRDQQIGNWIERAFDGIKNAREILKRPVG